LTVTNFDGHNNKHFDDTLNVLQQILNGIQTSREGIQTAREEIKSVQKSISNLKKDLYQNGVLRFKNDKGKKRAIQN